MTNQMIKIDNGVEKMWMVLPYGKWHEMYKMGISYVKTIVDNRWSKVLNPGEVKLEDLPDDIQKEVKECLTCFDKSYVNYYNGEFHEAPGCGICASYPTDHFSCGCYNADDVYTPEERREHRRALSDMR